MAEISLSLKPAFIGITAGLLLFLVAFIGRAARGSKSRGKIIALSILPLLLWLVLTAILAEQGFLADFSSVPPRFVFVFLPALITLILLAALPRVRNFIGRGPTTWLVGIQVFRLFLELLLHELYNRRIIPEQMTFEGLNFDIVTGATAPIVAWLLYRNTPSAVTIARLWNVLGLLLVLNILVISILSSPTSFQVFTAEPANTFIAHFPFVWLPAFVVPIAILLHIWSLRTLESRGSGVESQEL